MDVDRGRPDLVKLPGLAFPDRVRRLGLAFAELLTGTGIADATLTGVDLIRGVLTGSALTGAGPDTTASALSTTDVRGDTSGDSILTQAGPSHCGAVNP